MSSPSKIIEPQASSTWPAAAFAALTDSAVAGGDLQALMQQTALCVLRVLGVERSAIWELAPDGKWLLLRAGAGWRSGGTDARIELDGQSSLHALVYGSREQLLLDWRSCQPDQPPWLRDHGVITSLYVPIPASGERHAVLSADSSTLQPLGEHELVLLCALANVLALAQQRFALAASVEQQLHERTFELERRRQVAQSLHEIMSILNSSHTLDGLAAYLIAQACRLLGTAAGALFRLQNTGALVLQASWGLLNIDTSELLAHSAPGETVRTRVPVRRSGSDQHGDGAAPSAVLAVPLLIRGELYGALALYDHAPRSFNDEEERLAIALSDHAALAIENARLVAAAQDRAVLEERQRLARDLHDSVTQALYGVTLHAQAARRLLDNAHVDGAADSLRALQDTAQEALDEMRLLIFELRPPILDQAGLVAALQARLEAVEGRVNLQTKLSAGQLGVLPPAVEHALYRIAQEALNNALKHAHAGSIGVELGRRHGQVFLEISDDGIGFDPSAPTGGLGLRGIRERVANLGGQLILSSAPGDGTRLRVEIAV